MYGIFKDPKFLDVAGCEYLVNETGNFNFILRCFVIFQIEHRGIKIRAKKFIKIKLTICRVNKCFET